MPLLLFCILAFACLAPGDTMPDETAQRAKNARRPPFCVAGYLPNYRIESFDFAAGERLTDLIYFSIEPKPDGELDTARATPDTLEKLKAFKRRYPKVRLLIALGGWERSSGFAPMATDAAARSRFVRALTDYCRNNGFDGVDFDWEHPANDAEKTAYSDLICQTKEAFRPHRLMLTVTIGAWETLRPDAYRAADRIQVMAYDRPGRHATFEIAKADMESQLKQGAPREKLCLGLPFYGREIEKRTAITYAEIVQQHRPAPDQDEAAGFYFNGPATIQRKTRYALESGFRGVMFWELGQDTRDNTSLLRAIHQIVNAR